MPAYQEYFMYKLADANTVAVCHLYYLEQLLWVLIKYHCLSGPVLACSSFRYFAWPIGHRMVMLLVTISGSRDYRDTWKESEEACGPASASSEPRASALSHEERVSLLFERARREASACFRALGPQTCFFLQNQQKQGAGRNGERELNPFRHVQLRPPANAGTEEFRREMLQMAQRFAPRVSDSRTRALELERELNSGTSTGISVPEGSSPRTPHPKYTPVPQFPGLRTVIMPPPAPGSEQGHRLGLLTSDSLDRADRRLLSPEPASVALPLSPTSADGSRFLVLSSPTGEESVPGLEGDTLHQGRDATVTTPGLTSGQITPPPRPTPPPTAPRRTIKREYHEYSRTPGPDRTGVPARGTGAPRTAPPRGPGSYPRAGHSTGQRSEAAAATTQKRGGRRISPTYISPPTGQASTSPFVVDAPIAGPSSQPAPRTAPLSVFDRLSSSSLKTQRSGNATTVATPRDPQPTGRTVTPTAMPVSFLPPENATPFPGMRTAHNIRDTLRKVAAETPKGSSERTTPADSTVIRKDPIPTRLSQYQLEHSGSNAGSSALKPTSHYGDLQDDSPLVIKGIKAASTKGRKRLPASESKAPAIETDKNSLGLPQPNSGQQDCELAHKPQNIEPDDMDPNGSPHGNGPSSGVPLGETLDSLESLRGAIKRIESMMKDYNTNLKVDAKELKRYQKSSSYRQDYNVREMLTKGQKYYSDRVEPLLRDFRKKEAIYHRNLDSLQSLDHDPIIDPTVDIPSMDGQDERRQLIAFRGRLLIRDALIKLGYDGGPVRSFLGQLDTETWKAELTQAIVATDPTISNAIQLLNRQGSNLEQGGEINFDRIDLNDLSSLPWGSFKLNGLGYPDETEHPEATDDHNRKGKGKAGTLSETEDATVAQSPRRTPSPILESGSDGEVDYERTFMTDPGMTPRLKSRLTLLERQEKMGKSEKGRPRQLTRK
ncbi:hypothetical protein TWF481_004467 [Arthrobotrys musiformis]|uniref:Uncharacterized protein n=1 Tax=Arthrobotrys musiformis TaxID=47236 RepID=A0AAV9WL74_9PEZI